MGPIATPTDPAHALGPPSQLGSTRSVWLAFRTWRSQWLFRVSKTVLCNVPKRTILLAKYSCPTVI